MQLSNTIMQDLELCYDNIHRETQVYRSLLDKIKNTELNITNTRNSTKLTTKNTTHMTLTDAQNYLATTNVKLSKHGYLLASLNTSRRLLSLEKAINEYGKENVLNKLRALIIVWKSRSEKTNYVQNLEVDFAVLN